jgi:uracil-DNA glycosylase
VIVALGKIAYDAVSRFFVESGAIGKPPPFAHGAEWTIRRTQNGGPVPLWIIGSYHPSRQNTQTGKLTKPMFDRIWRKVVRLSGEAKNNGGKKGLIEE